MIERAPAERALVEQAAVGGGHGTAFVLKPDGLGGFQETVIHTFAGGADGETPVGGLVFDADGNLFGTTFYGGINTAGTVFELARDQSGYWIKATIYTFSGFGHPTGLVLGKNGRLYGMTSAGGNKGGGTAFELARDQSGTWIETDIYDFDVNVGNGPNTTPILDARGNLYGTFLVAGKPGVFELQHHHENWQLIQLQRFPSNTPLTSSLVFDALGNLYGTTSQGGAFGLGMVYRLSPSGHGWTRSILYNFRGKADGGYSIGRLAIDAQGNLYSAEEGGQYKFGVVYEITP